MSDREIMNSKNGVPMWWKPNMVFLKEEWMVNPDLKHFINYGVDSNHKKCECTNPRLVELWEHDSCVRGRIDTTICVKCNKIYSFTIVR